MNNRDLLYEHEFYRDQSGEHVCDICGCRVLPNDRVPRFGCINDKDAA